MGEMHVQRRKRKREDGEERRKKYIHRHRNQGGGGGAKAARAPTFHGIMTSHPKGSCSRNTDSQHERGLWLESHL